MADVLHSTLVGTDSHEPKGAESALIDSVYVSDGLGSGSWGFTSPPNRVVVTSEADLGVDMGAYIQAPDSTELYIVGTVAAPVILTKELRLGENTVIKGASPSLAVVEYTGSATAITATSRGVIMSNFRLKGPGKGVVGSKGMILDNSAIFSVMLFDNLLIHDFDCIASFDIGTGAFFAEGINIFNAVDGLVFVGTSSGNVGFQQGGGFLVDNALIDLDGSVNGDVFLENLVGTISTASGSALKGLSAGANISGRGRMTNCFFSVSGGGSVLDTIATTDLQWSFSNNTGIPDSHSTGAFRTSGAPGNTLLGSGKVKVAGTTVLDSGTERFDDDGGVDNRLKYLGTQSIKTILSGYISGQSSGGSPVSCDIILRTNGDVGTDQVVLEDVEFDATTDSTFTSSAIIDVNTDDYVELFVERTAGASDLTVKAFSMLMGIV